MYRTLLLQVRSTDLLRGPPIQSGFFLDSYNTQHVLPLTHPKQYEPTAFYEIFVKRTVSNNPIIYSMSHEARPNIASIPKSSFSPSALGK
jgi:hypothetical protein